MARREKSFIAIDGEGVTDAETTLHRYVLLCASSGESTFRANGLSTRAIFRWLLALDASHPDTTFMGFGCNYDVNMWLRDLSRESLQELWDTGATVYKVSGETYLVEWIPSKFFSVSDGSWFIRVYDVFGFFQSSFLNALADWEIDAPEVVGEQKGRRGLFTVAEKEQLKHYCHLECELLVQLMDKLKRALKFVDLVPNQWYGPGAIAARMLQENVRQYHRHDSEWPEKVQTAIRHAYYGGRVEMFMQGQLKNVTVYDIKSAYPWGALYLPSLAAGAEWFPAKEFDPTAGFALWFVRWNCEERNQIAPFPFRHKRAIYYSNGGSGWYHAIEVKRALKIFGDQIEVINGYVFEPGQEYKPFGFIREIFAERQRLKERGHAGEKAYKLALNSMYGKLAQGLGYMGSVPAFQSYLWAGAITAATRARVLDMLSVAPDAAVFCATDSVAFATDPDFECSSQLGGLERSHFRKLLVVQSGVYSGTYDDGEEYARARGFFSRELDFDQIERLWAKDGRYGELHYKTKRFFGLGTSLLRRDFDGLWRRWIEEKRSLAFHVDQTRKVYDWQRDMKYGAEPRRVERLFPLSSLEGQSGIYVPKHGHIDKGNEVEDTLQGFEQPFVME